MSKSSAFTDSLKQAAFLGVMEQMAGSMLVEAESLALHTSKSAESCEPCKL